MEAGFTLNNGKNAKVDRQNINDADDVSGRPFTTSLSFCLHLHSVRKLNSGGTLAPERGGDC